ncbi:tRNA (adenosine(37)-N6)-dimethylallyltransferase MiaA [Alcaligenaceae bacterium B3P038]|nr:tRNA (adenosine(37)-N6)-dimethylallyltransferase MiaA [Alcaligenaceae bacterium B3P038]
MMSAPLLCLAGPTAAGKSAAVLAIAQRWPIEVINVDSATIYRHMDVGTAKPSRDERARVPQHLLDILDPLESYSAAQFFDDAHRLADEITARGRTPILAGGTMMYFKALREGLSDLPQADPAIRAELDARAAQLGWPAMHAELAARDPETAARLAPNDSQRVQRALEICLITGQTMSALLAAHRPVASTREFVTLSLEPSDRLALHARIAQRFDAMLDHGLVDEVRVLHARGDLHTGLPSIRCVGYRQIWGYLDGEVDMSTARDQAIAATRQLAKRQLTWLRALPERIAIDCLAANAVEQVIDTITPWMPPRAA